MNKIIHHLGWDVHKSSIAVAISNSSETQGSAAAGSDNLAGKIVKPGNDEHAGHAARHERVSSDPFPRRGEAISSLVFGLGSTKEVSDRFAFAVARDVEGPLLDFIGQSG